MPCLILFSHKTFQNYSTLLTKPDREVKASQSLSKGTMGDGIPGFQNHQMVRQPGNLIRGVGDIQHREFQFIPKSFHVW